MNVTRAISVSILVILSLSSLGCTADRTAVGEPIETDLSLTDEDSSKQIGELLDAARRHPRDARRRAELGMAYEVGGLIDAALGSYEQAAALDPTEPRWSYYAALIRAKRHGDLEGALAWLDDVIEIDPGYAPAHLHRAQWLMDLDRLDLALSAYEQATGLAPHAAQGPIGQARVYLKRGKPEKAIEIVETIEPGRRDTSANQILGAAYRDVGDLDRAREAFAGVQARFTSEWPDRWHQEKSAYVTGFAAELAVAKQMIESGRNEQAIALLVSLRQQRPDNPDVASTLAVAYQRSGRPEEALRALDEGLEIDPGYYPLHVNLSRYHAGRGDLDAAVRHLDRAIEIHPALATAHESRGLYLIKMGRIKEAYASFRNAVTRDPSRSVSLFNLAFIEANLKEWSIALRHIERAIAINPSSGRAHALHGWVLAERGDFDGAEEALARARALESASPQLDAIAGRVEQLRSASR